MANRTDAASEKPKYSIIIATFNRASYLNDCLNSLAMQKTDVPFEVLISDDGSTDETPQIAEKYNHYYPSKFKTVRQNHKELAAAKNLGILSSAGEVLLFLDDDTVVPSDFLDKVDSVFAKKTVDVLGFVDLPLARDSYLAKGIRYLENFSTCFFQRDVRRQLKGHIIVKRSMIERSGLFDESRGYRRAEDTELNYRLSAVGSKMGFSDDIFVYHRSPTFTSWVKRSISRLINTKMLDVPSPFWYYRIHLGLATLVFLALLFILGITWKALAWIFSVALLALVTFSLFVSMAATKTPLYVPAILIVSITRVSFILMYSIRFLFDRAKRFFQGAC